MASPDYTDALSAASEHHKLLFENDRVRVLETRIEPGQITGLHTHCWPCVMHIQSWSDVVRRDKDGNVLWDTRDQTTKLEPGQTMWGPPLELHTLENIGDRTILVINVEIKS